MNGKLHRLELEDVARLSLLQIYRWSIGGELAVRIASIELWLDFKMASNGSQTNRTHKLKKLNCTDKTEFEKN